LIIEELKYHLLDLENKENREIDSSPPSSAFYLVIESEAQVKK